MLVDFTKKTNISFKQIKLSDSELQASKNGYKKVFAEPLITKHKENLFDIFEPHLNKEVDLKNYVTGPERKNFATALYVKFFEILENNRLSNSSIEDFIGDLNDFSENFVGRQVEKDSPGCAEYSVTKAKNLTNSICKYLGCSKEVFWDKAQKLPILQYLYEYSIPFNVKYVSEKLGFTKEEYISFFNVNPKTFIYPAEKVVEKAYEAMNVLEIDNLEQFRYLVKLNPQLLAMRDVESQMNELSDFLNVDKDTLLSMVRSNLQLLTTKISSIKSNFYMMKNYLNVDNEKMQELAVIAPLLVTKSYEKNKKNLEDISNTLGILPISYIQKANFLPAMYSITSNKLEKWIDFIVEKFNYSRLEAKDYIAKNLGILIFSLNKTRKFSEKN